MEIQVSVKDKDTLVLQTDAHVGDIICLNKISNVDLSAIQDLLSREMEREVQKKIQEALSRQQRELEATHAAELQKSLAGRDEQWRVKNQELEKSLSEVRHQKDMALKEKEAELQSLHEIQKTALENKELEVRQSLQKELNDQKLLNQNLNLQLENQQKIHEQEKENIRKMTALETENRFNKEKEEMKDSFVREREELERQIAQLQNTKASLNVKRIGENLEQWCSNEVLSYMQNGFSNCLWKKDNAVVQEENEAHGSKADYLFWIYASEEKKEEELLAGICLDMKDENPDSTNRKTNSDYFRQLDRNRTKKHCKYAVLVSNLELDRPNDIPIYRVQEYPDMYVVRPAYLMTFLNMIVSLTTYFSKMILKDRDKTNKEIAFDEYHRKFEELKNTYLDKPLASLSKSIEELYKQNEAISKASDRISETLDGIKRSYLQQIEEKLARLSEKLGAEERKYLRKIGQ